MTPVEKQFMKKLDKAGWTAYKQEETGRVVTNAYEHELEKLEKISGLPCEIVAKHEVFCNIGPKL